MMMTISFPDSIFTQFISRKNLLDVRFWVNKGREKKKEESRPFCTCSVHGQEVMQINS